MVGRCLSEKGEGVSHVEGRTSHVERGTSHVEGRALHVEGGLDLVGGESIGEIMGRVWKELHML